MKKPTYTIIDDLVIVCITQKNNTQHDIFLDLESWLSIKHGSLCVAVSKTGKPRYVQLSFSGVAHYLHRYLLNTEFGILVDHIDGNPFNNRLKNLRPCTQLENMQNIHAERGTTGSRGVNWNTRDCKWQATVVLNGKNNFLGLYEDQSEAEKVVKEFRAKHMPFSRDARESL